MPLRVSLVNLQKFTFHAWLDCASIRMLAPAQNIRSRPPVMTTAITVERLAPSDVRVVRAIGDVVVVAGLVLIARAVTLG